MNYIYCNQFIKYYITQTGLIEKKVLICLKPQKIKIMRRLFLLFVFLLAGIMSFAQTADRKWAIGLGGGIYHGNTLDGNGFIPQLYLSRYLSPSFDLKLDQELGLFNSEVNYNDLDFSGTFLNLSYKLNNGHIFKEDGTLRPYLYAGPGLIYDQDINNFTFDAGVGTKIGLSESVALFVEGGYIDGLGVDKAAEENTFTESFYKLTAGIEFSFGKAKDTDGDGVPDRKDLCPDTPPGVAVDEDGCPFDRDGDGVYDYEDDCPDEAGLPALNGCPDRDGDGIADKDDLCPDEAGLAQFDGCPDSDGDGVPDNKDLCPDTPRGYKVDADGCPIDTDGDGLVDEEDDCPTEAGPVENNGCPVVEMDEETIYFDFDKSDIKPAATSELNAIVQLMKENPKLNVSLYGHADATGTEAYNMGLSERRADAARDYLITNGIAPERITTVRWFGESEPVAPNDTSEGRALNRRVEIDSDN